MAWAQDDLLDGTISTVSTTGSDIAISKPFTHEDPRFCVVTVAATGTASGTYKIQDSADGVTWRNTSYTAAYASGQVVIEADGGTELLRQTVRVVINLVSGSITPSAVWVERVV